MCTFLMLRLPPRTTRTDSLFPVTALVRSPRAGAEISDADGRPANRPVVRTALSGDDLGKGNYDHFMLKEIYEQPAVIGDTLQTVLNPATRTITMPPIGCDLAAVPKVTVSACGTAHYAGLVEKY